MDRRPFEGRHLVFNIFTNLNPIKIKILRIYLSGVYAIFAVKINQVFPPWKKHVI